MLLCMQLKVTLTFLITRSYFELTVCFVYDHYKPYASSPLIIPNPKVL